MVYVYGMNIPIVEVMFIIVVLFIIGLVFMIWQMLQVKSHIKILEKTTFEIKQFEEAEETQVKRLETDVKNFENDEAEIFVARVIPTVAKLQNFVIAQLFKGMTPEKVVDSLVAKNVERDLATRVVNQVGYYLDYYHKLPNNKHAAHVKAVDTMQIPTGKNVPKMPDVFTK